MSNHEIPKTKTVQNKKLAADSVTLQKQKQSNIHIPVLLEEVMTFLAPKPSETYLDLTGGYGGHASAVVAMTKNMSGATLVDRDMNAVQALQQALPEAKVIHSDSAGFLESDEQTYDLILADIGVSSPHLDQASRGFSYSSDGPLDMRMDQTQGATAADIVNTYTEEAIADILFRYGQERASRRIARKIVEQRPLRTTLELANIVQACVGMSKSKHPETKSFQALRIYVNDELSQLESILLLAPKRLKSGGRLAIISFHSLEDRLIKERFKELGQDSYDAMFCNLTKKPITPSKDEIVSNPRARSAKLRVLQRK